jgi:hypothetical protein
MAMIYLEEHGWTVKDPKTYRFCLDFKNKCIPDIMAIRPNEYVTEWGRKHKGEECLIVEVETNPTAKTIKKKMEQYPGWTLKILDCRKITGWESGWRFVMLGDIEDWLEAWL